MSTPETQRETRADYLRTEHTIGAIVALDTIDILAERITRMVSHDRRMVKIHRYGHHGHLTIDPGLRPDPENPDAISLKNLRYPEGNRQFWVDLSPGIHGFGFSSEVPREASLRDRYTRHHKRLTTGEGDSIYEQPVTHVTITGRGTEAGRSDRIDIEDFNVHGVAILTTIVFQCDWDY